MGEYSKILQEYVAAWNQQDVDGMASFYTEDMIYIDRAVGVTLNKKTIGSYLKKFISRAPIGFKVTPYHICEDPESEKIAFEWHVEGESESGFKMSIRGISMLQMRGSLIAKNTDYWNRADSPLMAAFKQKEA